MMRELKYKVYDSYPKGDEVRYNTHDPKAITPIQIIGGDR